MELEKWPIRWRAALKACEAKGGKITEPLSISAPATLSQVEEVETSLGMSLPESFRITLLDFASEVSMWWQLPNGLRSPKPLNGIFSG